MVGGPVIALGRIQRVEVGTTVLRADDNQRVSTFEQHEVHEQARRAPVTVRERVNGDKPLVGVERRLGRGRGFFEPPGEVAHASGISAGEGSTKDKPEITR